ncbi:EAL domain-containing protein [Paenibacillus sp. sgz302251]|uniref:EAL domain-containing protein n=1 Tax=Paenibacillus sp. sgz302251 TaxID=3414493 RepID=UPI003C7B7300
MQCESCLVEEKGYSVYFDKRSEAAFLDKYVANYPASQQVKINDQFYWLHEKLFYNMLDYALAHLNVGGIKAVEAKREAASAAIDRLRPIEQFQQERDAHWIDDVIRKPSIQTYYQPIVAMKGSDVEPIGFELLSRGLSADGKMISPYDMFEAAKQRNRLFALDRACRLEAVRNAGQVKGKMAFINFLPTSIYNPQHCLQSTVKLVEEIGISPESIVFEVVESAEVKNLEHLKSILNYYREYGFRYALDDVGTGFNSVEVLAELEPDVVKLAMEFVQGVSNDPAKRKVAMEVAKIAGDKGAKLLAEGIESRDDMESLKELGYEWFQGYYFGKPTAQPQLVGF